MLCQGTQSLQFSGISEEPGICSPWKPGSLQMYTVAFSWAAVEKGLFLERMLKADYKLPSFNMHYLPTVVYYEV